MSISKKALRENNCKLKGSLRKNGFDRWRYVFNAVNPISNEERNLFIELSILNPALGSEKIILYNSSNEKIGAENLQAALVGNVEIENSATDVVPSYCCVRAGILGSRPRQLVRYFPCEDFIAEKKSFNIKIGECAFSDTDLYGSLTVTKEDLRKNPTRKSDSGLIVWNLKYERIFCSSPVSAKNCVSWFASGINAKFSGSVTFDGVEYIVSPDNSFGYTDKSWGVSLPFPFVHVSSSRLVSLFTGSFMKNSGFVLEGDFDGRATLIAKFENDEYSFGKRKKIRKFNSIWSCVRTPSNLGSEELHWSVSFNSKKYILDVDVFSDAAEMIVKEYDMPQGQGVLLKILESASARGEIRLYRQKRKSLELIQHAKIFNAVADYGEKDTLEN